MISLEEAQAKLLDDVVPLEAETVQISKACGRFLSNDVHANLTQPPFDASSMDGYAIRYDDLPGPWRVIGESAAGSAFERHASAGHAVRIFTGAPMPEGADTVVIQEETSQDGPILTLIGEGPALRGASTRAAGLDFRSGAMLATAGTRVTPALAGLLTAAGHGTLDVRRRARVVLIATGTELVPPGVVPGQDQIVSSNGIILAALFASAGAEVEDAGIVPDDLGALAEAIGAARGADLLVTIGGASVGDHDLVAPALEAAGAAIDFWKVALRPGKPLMMGQLGSTRVLGLPGNPVSAYVCALLFGLPFVRALAGDPHPLPRTRFAQAAVALPANSVRRDFMRATLRDGRVTPAAVQDSSMLSVLASSNALLIRAPNAPPAAAGEHVEIILLDSDSYGP